MKNDLDKHLKAYSGDNLYDFDNNILLNWYSKRIIELGNAEQSMLELGLGHGFTALNFSNFFNKHVILDGSADVIQNFKNNNPDFQSKIIETYFEVFDTDEKFDLIVMGFILEHVDDPVQIIRHYKKFLTSGGKMFLAVPNAEVMNRRLGHLAGMLSDMEELSKNDTLLGHKRYYTQKSLEYDIHLSGFEVVNMEGIYLKPMTTQQMISLELGDEIIESLCLLGVEYPELSCGIMAEVKET